MTDNAKQSYAQKINPRKAAMSEKLKEEAAIDGGDNNDAEIINIEITKLREENDKTRDHLMRLAAEMENLRKRTQKDVEEASKYGITKFARDLIEVLENLNRAEASFDIQLLEQNESLKNYHAGIELTRKSLEDVFNKNSIKRINPINEPFNHELHQAITQAPSSDHTNGQIMQVVQTGYTINDRLLRPALVIVAKND